MREKERNMLNDVKKIIKDNISEGNIDESVLENFEKIESALNMATREKYVQTPTQIEKFSVQEYLDGCIIVAYNGFDDEEIFIPKEIKGRRVLAIGKSAFCNAKTIRIVHMPDSLVAIGECAFSGCESLECINLPIGLKVINNRAFFKTMLREVRIPNTVFYMGEYVFAKSDLENIELSRSCACISMGAFYECKNLCKIILPNGVKKIGDKAFANCIRLNMVSLANSLQEIGNEAFCNCTNLLQLDVPMSVEFIGRNAFSRKYFVRPDRRYNPRTKYENLNLVIRCFAGSATQVYARNNELSLEPSEKDYNQDVCEVQYASKLVIHTPKQIELDDLKRIIIFIAEEIENWVFVHDFLNPYFIFSRNIDKDELQSITKMVKSLGSQGRIYARLSYAVLK